MMDSEDHYTAIKSLSRLLGNSNSKHGHKQHFCLNCLQGFHSKESRDSLKVPFVMYGDFEANLKPMEGPSPHPEESYTKESNQHVPSGFCVNSVFAYGEVENPLKKNL